MMRRGLVFGTARDWSWALSVADADAGRGKRKVPLRERNFILDNLAAAIDAEAEARKAARERLKRRPLPRFGP